MKKLVGKTLLALMLTGTILMIIRMPVGSAASQTEINNAIEKGLAYLNYTQASDGHWGGSYAPVACTAMSVLSFENAPNSHFGWNSTDLYNTTVQKGLDWLFANAYVQTLSTQAAGNPDTNNNGIGIYFSDGNPIYETPMVLMAIVASQAPTNLTTTGPANVTGRTYHDIAVDVVDYLAWAQNEGPNGRGGWRYGPNYGNSDNSVSQWPALGLMAAELWGIEAPDWVKSELLNYWIPYADDLRGNYSSNYYYGAFGYGADAWGQYGLEDIAETAAGILELTYCGVSKTDPRILAAEGFIVRDWNTTGGPYGWDVHIGNFYAMYGVMKACRLATPTPIVFVGNGTGTTVEWYNGTGQYADLLVAHQTQFDATKAYWTQWVLNPDGNVHTDLSTAWGVLMLEFVPVKVTYEFTVTVIDSVTLKPLVGATVSAVGPEARSDVTDTSGKVVFDNLQAGSYQVNASYTGYLPSTPETVSVISDTSFVIKLSKLVAPDFSISASPPQLNIIQGNSGTSTINITSVNDFNSAVGLIASGAPTGVTLDLHPASVTPASGGFVTSTLKVTANATAALGTYILTVTGTSGSLTHNATICLIVTKSGLIKACVEFKPEELNLKSKGKWITCYIKLQKGYNVSDIDPSTIMLNGTIPASKTKAIWDCDNDAVIWLMVKFNRTQVEQFILNSTHLKTGSKTVKLTVTGSLKDGTQFQGTDKIRVMLPDHHDHEHCNDPHSNDFQKQRAVIIRVRTRSFTLTSYNIQ